jgi:hypothetical protein
LLTYDPLSCGVRGHLDKFGQPGNEVESLRQIARVLRPSGHFLIYQLPQRLTVQEAIARAVKCGNALIPDDSPGVKSGCCSSARAIQSSVCAETTCFPRI